MPHDTLSAKDLELLQERTERLAMAGKQSTTAWVALMNQEDVFLSFRVKDERYALPLYAVREVIPLRSIVFVPNAPDHVMGLVRLRGKILSLVDLRRFWQGIAVGHADSDLAVVLDTKGFEIGLICTEVEELIEVPPAAIMAVPKNITGRLAVCLRGMAQREIMLIDPNSLLRQPGFLVRMGRAGE